MLAHLRIALLLGARSRLALLYGYLFPIVFLLSFLVLYRVEDPPLLRHMGALLTVTVLSGACLGLSTSLVSERERGVWRRYRLAPVTTGSLVASTLLARYLAVLGAGLLQLLLAMAIGRWVPAHPFELWLTYSLVTATLLGLGLVLAALADTVYAVQALGQCLFLPMLILGGVVVRLESLPEWTLPLTVFFPGRYAVDIMQACMDGRGLGAFGFPLAALLVIGAAACLGGIALFRWETQARLLSSRHTSWIAVALASWLVIGGLAIERGEVTPRRGAERVSASTAITAMPIAAAGPFPAARVEAIQSSPAPSINVPVAPPPSSTGSPAKAAKAPAEPWRALTEFDFAALPIGQVPPDTGNVAPIATDDQTPAGNSAELLKRVERALPTWAPGHVSSRVQRVRNYLLILGVADYAQSSIERFLPGTVLTHMLKEFPREELAQLVCWVALHSDEGDVSALNDPLLVELGAANLDPIEVRTRTYYYGVKLTRWIIGW